MKKTKLYSEHTIAMYAINYVISWMHGSEESFDEWYGHVRDVHSLKKIYSDVDVFDYEYLKYICEGYCEYSKKVNWDAIFDVWYKPFMRINKIRKIIGKTKK